MKSKKKGVQSFYIYKINSKDIVNTAFENDEGKIEYSLNLDWKQAVKTGRVVSLGDCQVLMQLRKLTQSTYSAQGLKQLLTLREEIKKDLGTPEKTIELQEVQKQIDAMLFVPEIITVKCERKKDYKDITNSCFKLNGREYVRFACGSGQTRRNSPTFIDKRYYDELNSILFCGLDKKIERINIAKFNAYFGLYLSAMKCIYKTPRFCVVDDNTVILKDQKIYWIDTIDNVNSVTEQQKDLEMNTHDGMGLIDPFYANELRRTLRMDWDVCNWGIRGPYVKGLLVPFDFKHFADVKGVSPIIKDLWGNEVDIRDIDIIFTKSQVKMWKYYKDCDEFKYYIEKNHLYFGICRFNKKRDDEYSLLNYQYIQTLELENEDIHKLIKPTIENIKKICSGDKIHTLWFLLGIKDADTTLEDILRDTNTNFVKAILCDDRVLGDPYIRQKIYKLISRQIDNAKLGRVYVRGNYQAMIADPYALCEHIFGLEVVGKLKPHEIYCQFWLDRNVNKVDCCRSPMVCQEEHNVMNVVNPFNYEEGEENWYQYISSGLIYNIWDCSTIIHSDSDFDFDIGFSTDNEIMINHIVDKPLPITYEKVKVPDQKFCYKQFVKTDLKGFKAKIGSITNNSSCMFGMLPMFKGDPVRENIIKERIRILRKLIGNSIDAAKGVEYIPFPSDWKKEKRIEDTDTEEVKRMKRRHNSLIIRKKPYFMTYIYPELKQQYMAYRKNYNFLSKVNFNCNLKQLIEKQDKTDAEIKFLSRYNYFSPVLNTKCIMNMLCKSVESVDFDFKYFKVSKNEAPFDYTVYLKNNPLSVVIYKEVEKILKNTKSQYFKVLDFIREAKENLSLDEARQEVSYSAEMVFDECEKQLMSIVNNHGFMADYVIDIAYKKNDNVYKNIVWSIFGRDIAKRLAEKVDHIDIPVVGEDDENSVEIYGEKVKLVSISNEEIKVNEEFIDSSLANYDEDILFEDVDLW